MVHRPVRSPNCRYVAVSAEQEGKHDRPSVLLDLKNKEVVVMKRDSGGDPFYSWTSDSKQVYFEADQQMNADSKLPVKKASLVVINSKLPKMESWSSTNLRERC